MTDPQEEVVGEYERTIKVIVEAKSEEQAKYAVEDLIKKINPDVLDAWVVEQ